MNAKELEKLLAVVDLSLNSDRVFTSSEEKSHCLDSLKLYAAHVSAVAYDDSLISLVVGRDSCMQRRIAQTEHAVSQSIKWISRLNDLYKGDIGYSQKELDDDYIKLIGPGSDRYITIWYRTSEAIRQAERILILGHSIHATEHFFCDMVRNSRQAEITLIDRDMETVCRNLCHTLQLSINRYTPLTVQGHPARKYDNRIIVVQADLNDIDLSPWLENENTSKK